MPVITSQKTASGINVKIDARQLDQLSAAFRDLAAGEQAKALRFAVNRVGDMTYTRVVATLAEETGAANREVRKEVTKHPSAEMQPTYKIKARGGYWSTKRFKASQRKKGVSASPWNVRRLFPGTFIGPGGHVYHRVEGKMMKKDEKKQAIKKHWGPAIPKEMVRGRTAEITHQMVEENLPKRVAYETERALARAKARHGL